MRTCYLLPTLIASIAAFAQEQPQNTGISPEWDVRANMKSLLADVGKLDPLLQQLKPQDWLAKGASETYIDQLQSARASLQHLAAATNALAADPDKLVTALDTFFRMEKMELLLGSLKEGVRRYGSSDAANQMTELLASNTVHRDRLRQHISELAAAREQEFKVVDREAQRCRSALSQQGSQTKGSPSTRNRERK